MRIGTRYLLMVCTLLLAIILSLFIIFNYLIIPWSVDSVVKKSDMLACYIEDTWGYLNDTERQMLVANITLDNPDISYILFIDSDGRALYHSDPGRVGMIFDDQGSLNASRYGQKYMQTYTRDPGNASSPYHGERVIDLLLPYHDDTGKLIGAINVGISLDKVDLLKNNYYYLLALMSAMTLVMVVILSTAHFNDVISPLEKISGTIRNGKQDEDYHIHIPLNRNDEIGIVAGEINNMSDRISGLLADVKKREKDLEEYIDHLLTFNGKITPDGTFVMTNLTAAQSINTKKEDIIGRKIWDMPWWNNDAAETEKLKKHIEAASKGDIIKFEAINYVLDGKRLIMDISLNPVIGVDGNVDYIVIEGRNVTSRKNFEIMLKESEERFRATFEQAAVGIAHMRPDGRFIRANRKFYEITGYTSDDLKDITCRSMIHPEDRCLEFELITKFIEENMGSCDFERRLIKKDDTIIWVNITASLLKDTDNNPKYFICVVEDITDRKRAVDQVKASLTEKEVLLKEVHHRVKNNMQIISSLLVLQSEKIKNEKDRMIFLDGQNRIRSMAMVHEKLYRSGSFAVINFAEYMPGLIRNLCLSYKVNSSLISVNMDVEEIELDIDTAIPCGLMINELVSNAIKYAFPDNRKGEITVKICKVGGRTCIVVSDNGIGLPQGLDIDNADSLGLQLVKVLAGQLNGTMEIERNGGTVFRILIQPAVRS